MIVINFITYLLAMQIVHSSWFREEASVYHYHANKYHDMQNISNTKERSIMYTTGKL